MSTAGFATISEGGFSIAIVLVHKPGRRFELIPLLVERESEQGLPEPLFFDFLNTAEAHTRAFSAAVSCTQNHPAR
jgi:hypothetical protein